MKRFVADRRGSAAAEFALIGPTFLIFLFLLLDGGRAIFAKQSLNELAAATARCAAIKGPGCADTASVQSWAVTRGLVHDNLQILAANVAVDMAASCSGQSGMAQVTITMPWRRGAMNLLPQSAMPANLVAASCFPIAT